MIGGSTGGSYELYRPHWKYTLSKRAKERMSCLLTLVGPLVLDEFLELLEGESLRGGDGLGSELGQWVFLSLSLYGVCEELKCAMCSARLGLMACSRCHSVRYCSVTHQKEHWKQHKKDCSPRIVPKVPSELDFTVESFLRLAMKRLKTLVNSEGHVHSSVGGGAEFIASYAAEVGVRIFLSPVTSILVYRSLCEKFG